MAYYSDLSAADSSGGDNDSEDEEDDDYFAMPSPSRKRKATFHRDGSRGEGLNNNNNNNNTISSSRSPANTTGTADSSATLSSQFDTIILHLDIDCFYCQCEHLDHNIPASRPLAIGQKHIIVTSNYAARAMGVKKLQLREDAYQACPQLQILEGSDLQRYRQHGRKVYDVFRECILQYYKNTISVDGGAAPQRAPAVSRGRGMDEMQADLSCLADSFAPSGVKKDDVKPIYIYGDQNETTTLTEDQTGAEAKVQAYDFSADDNNYDLPQQHHQHNANVKRCQKNLLDAAETLGRHIQRSILDRTGFTTTVGISVNPLLAKLASDLQKPSSVNVLYPWRAPPLMASMPLRKIPDAGYKTIKLLTPVLEQFHSVTGDSAKKEFWTCRDLLSLPRAEVKRVLESEEKIIMLLQRCTGLDTTTIVDDQGEPPKTISCENSFRRGTVITPDAVWQGLEDLYVRLPRLLKDRQSWSKHPCKAYPTTLRLTARVLDRNLLLEQQLSGSKKRRRRPFVTRSKQIPFTRGRELVEETDDDRQKAIVKSTVRPLVQSLVLDAIKPGDLNLTRINIAVTNFQDISVTVADPIGSRGGESQSSLGTTLQQPSFTQEYFGSQGGTKRSPTLPSHSSSSNKRPRQSSSLELAFKKQRNSVDPSWARAGSVSTPCQQGTQQNAPTASITSNNSLPAGIDPKTLAELPPEMVKDIIRDYNQVAKSKNSNCKKTPKPKARIDHFFARRTS